MKDWKVLLFDPKGPSLYELARQAFSSTQKGYDLLAEKFDHTPYRTSSDILDVVAMEIGKMETFDASLDICCGTGAVTGLLLDNTAERVVGLDISMGMMDVAARNLSCHPKSGILDFVQGEALHLPFENEFDVVTNFGGLGHIMNKDVLAFLDQVHKVLKPGGIFIIVTMEHPPVYSMAFWKAYSFNALIHLRNMLIKPPFIMYYLTFLLPKIHFQLESKGFKVELRPNLFPKPFHKFNLVIATKT